MTSMLDRFRLDGQVAIITGSGRGIGAACALYLASPASAYVTGEVIGVNGGIVTSQVTMPRANV